MSFYKTKITDRGLCHLDGLTALVEIGLGETAVDGSGFENVFNLTSLSWLIARKTNFSDQGVSYLPGFKSLTLLNLEYTKITDESVQDLIKLKQLDYLSVSNTAMTAKGVGQLRKSLPDCYVDASVGPTQMQ